MFREAGRAAWAEINLSNFKYNVEQIRQKIGPACRIVGIVKASAYGHGAVKISETLAAMGVRSFGVATLWEALELRDHRIPGEIIILGLTPNELADVIISDDLTPVVYEYDNAKAFSDAAAAAGKICEGYIKIDSGMGRIGLLPDDPETLRQVKAIAGLPNFRIKGMTSHLATADSADLSHARQQVAVFNEFCARAEAAGIPAGQKIVGNSGAVMEMPEAYFDAVRPGIILYGCYPSDEVHPSQLDLKPVMSVKAEILQLKDIPKGFAVGYGRHFIAERPSRIATIPIGYADGYPRAFSEQARVLVGGKKVPLAGVICMDQCMVDVTDVPGVKTGDEVIVMGSDGVNSVTAEEIGAATGTVNYEILCGFGQRLPKLYMRGMNRLP